MLSDVKARADASEVKGDSPRVEQATKPLREAREKHAQRIACLQFCEAICFVVGFLFLIRVHEDTEQVLSPARRQRHADSGRSGGGRD